MYFTLNTEWIKMIKILQNWLTVDELRMQAHWFYIFVMSEKKLRERESHDSRFVGHSPEKNWLAYPGYNIHQLKLIKFYIIVFNTTSSTNKSQHRRRKINRRQLAVGFYFSLLLLSSGPRIYGVHCTRNHIISCHFSLRRLGMILQEY